MSEALPWVLSDAAGAVMVRLALDLMVSLSTLVTPTLLLFASILALMDGDKKKFCFLRLASSVFFIISTRLASDNCGVVLSLHYFAVAIGVMKAFDLSARRNAPPVYKYSDPPSENMLAFLLLTELRYESFNPSYISTAPAPVVNKSNTKRKRSRSSPSAEAYAEAYHDLELSEPVNLLIHSFLFVALQTLFVQTNPTIIAVQILLAVYILWSSLQLVLRYHNSPPLFGPVYKATSLGVFWSEIWHSAFTSPCRSLAYDPVCNALRSRYGIPIQFARGAGVIASFFLMGVFHVYGLWPLLPGSALVRIGAFFVLNGVGTVFEEAIWGSRVHWVKTALVWTFELAVASWTAEGLNIPEGLAGIDWRKIC